MKLIFPISENASTGELKIVRMSACSAPCTGNTEIWMLVEKVRKSKKYLKKYLKDLKKTIFVC